MNLKKLTKTEKEDLKEIIDAVGFWYAISVGEFIAPDEVLDNQKDINKVEQALDVLIEYENLLNFSEE